MSMEKSIDLGLGFTLPMLRDLVNKLAVISGHCDLLGDDLKEGTRAFLEKRRPHFAWR